MTLARRRCASLIYQYPTSRKMTTMLHRCQQFVAAPHRRGSAPLGHARPRLLSPAAASAAAACQQQQQQQCTCGIVVVDHGSRRKASNDMLLEFCQLYQQLTQQPIVEPAHMEIAEPSIAKAVGRCVEAGARHVVIAPYFLSRGRHIQDDIPALVAAAQQQFPHITCSVAEPIGIDPLMVQLIHSRVRAALPPGCPAVSAAAGTTAGAAGATDALPVMVLQQRRDEGS